MSDFRPVPILNALYELVAAAAAPAGFTPGAVYPLVGLAFDVAAVPPVAYVVTIDDNGAIQGIPAARFAAHMRSVTPPA